MGNGFVTALSKSPTYTMIKANVNSITLLKGLGVEGDAHMGKTVKHRSRVAKDPTQPNLRQVHLIKSELHDKLREKGMEVKAGEMGENITTRGIDLLNLPTNTLLQIGSTEIQITGIRKPCHQLDGIQKGLMKATLYKKEDGSISSKTGIFAIVTAGGSISVNDKIKVVLPEQPHIPLDFV